MHRKRIRYAVLLVLFLFFIRDLPEGVVSKARFLSISALTPVWEFCDRIKRKCSIPFAALSSDSLEKIVRNAQELERENAALRLQIGNLAERLSPEFGIEEQIKRLQTIAWKEGEAALRSFYQRRELERTELLKARIKAVTAKVIYREPSLWSSFCWVNVGEKENRSAGERIVAKHSPVVIGNALVGVVEEVFETKSKVRLITDSKLVPSVRAVRGGEQNRILSDKIGSLIRMLETREELFLSEEEANGLFNLLRKVSERTGYFSEHLHLAKGEVSGSGAPLWRSRGGLLKGVGFNYDFPDEEGPARDLRTGEVRPGEGKKISLLKEGDLLLTTGLDGVFPPGLSVGFVRRVEPLREGSSSYEILAEAAVDNPNEIETVSVLPPVDGKI